jgi:sulfoxide reductase heme-binding subunit YedZ
LGALRRSLGLAAASCGAVHGTYALLALPGIPGLSLSVAWLRAGLLTLGILLTLFATSYDVVIRSLRLQHWKELHRLVYAAAVALAMHVILGPFGSPAIEVSFLSTIFVLLMLRVRLAGRSLSRSDED